MDTTTRDVSADRTQSTVETRAEPARRQWSFAPGVAPTAVPISTFIAAGICCGPSGLQLLSERVLAAVDPLQSAALIALGTLVGLSAPFIGRSGPRDGSRRAGAARVTAAIAVAGLAFAALDGAPAGRPLWTVFAAICAASASFAGRMLMNDAGDGAVPSQRPLVIADVAALSIGSAVLCVIRADGGLTAVGLLGQTAFVALLASSATAFLVASMGIEAEQRVFVLGMVLLLAGAVDALGLPAAGCGLLAGIMLRTVRGGAREPIVRALAYCERPIVIWLLIVAGARVTFLPSTAAAAAIFAAVQLVARSAATDTFPRSTFSAGLVGIALALDSLHLMDAGGAASIALAMVVTCAIISDLMAFAVRTGQSR